MNSRQFFGVCVTVTTMHFMQKLYYNSRVFLRYNNSSKIPWRKPWFLSFKVSQNFIVYESAEDMNLRVIFNRVKNTLSCNIFTKFYCDWDALLTCKDKLVSLNRFSSRVAFVASVSARVRRESWDETQKKGITGEGEGREGNACPQTPRLWKTAFTHECSFWLVRCW